MTDKQIIVDGKIKPITLEDVPTILELHKSKSFVEIAKMYGVTQNAIRYWVKKYNFKPLKQKDQIKILEEILKAKEQECEQKDKDIKYLTKCLDNSFKTQQDSELYWEREKKKLKAENEELRRRITKIFACLIKANRTGNITDTLWVGTITTLWDYIALTLGIEGDQTQIEEQILQKISECEVENEYKRNKRC